jgi:adsorption protein B
LPEIGARRRFARRFPKSACAFSSIMDDARTDSGANRMDVAGPVFAALELGMHEAALFAAAGFLILGASDLAVDLIWLVGASRRPRLTLEDIPPALAPGRLAVFVPAWDEAAVIGEMLGSAFAAWGEGDYRVYVGVYPNDPATLAALRRVADPRLRVVIGGKAGPTTKADCLNRLWEALVDDEAAQAWRAKAVILHDAEDLVHPAELGLFDALIERHDFVQLPVLPLIDPDSRWVGGHYADEFAEAHGKELVVRGAVGAALPSAGVGCAFARDALGEVAGAKGRPFDAESLTEDYELGLRIGAQGGSAAFVRIAAGPARATVATREYFPGTLDAAVAQKSRWMAGIALSGWDRLGWAGGLGERWMRLRDRQSLLAALLLLAGYLAMALWLLLKAREGAGGPPPRPLPEGLSILLEINLAMLGWRLAVRAAFTASAYGWREGLRAVPRALVGNLVSMLAAWRALVRYRALRRTGLARWDKTAHRFPTGMTAP